MRLANTFSNKLWTLLFLLIAVVMLIPLGRNVFLLPASVRLGLGVVSGP